MEEPANRRSAEEAAARARKEAEKIAKELGEDCSKPSTSAPPKKKKHGDNVFGLDGEVDYTTAPRVTAPEGMRTVLTIKNDCWDVQFIEK
jgi:hypothetical protein